jgi:hypothetical protein
MKRVACIIVLALVSVTALIGSACGGDDDNGDDPTPVVTGTITSASVPTPFPTPMVTGTEAVSESKGYAATFPEGWRPRFNLVQTSDASADVYFEPLKEGANVQANIAVTCLVGSERSQSERAIAEQTAVARLGLNEDITVGTIDVGGREATTITYTTSSQQDPNQPHLDKTDIVFNGDICNFTITTINLAGEREQYQPIFDAFLDSFRLLN